MRDYEITFYSNGVKKTRIVKADSKDEALKIAWSLTDEETVYVTEC